VGCALRIRLSLHSERVYSVTQQYDDFAAAKAACAKVAIDEDLLEFIKHGNGQTQPAHTSVLDYDNADATLQLPPAAMSLQGFFESLPRPFPEPIEGKTATEINAPSWLNVLIQSVKGTKITLNFIWILEPKYALHGAVLRVERPGECKSFLVDPQFPKRADAKAAACLVGMSQGIGDYIRECGKAVENKIPPETRSRATDSIMPMLSAEYSKIWPNKLPDMYKFERDKDAYGCTMTLKLVEEPQPEQKRTWTAPADYSSKTDAKVAVVTLAFDDGAIEFLRFRGEPPPPGYVVTLPPPKRTDGADAGKKNKKRKATDTMPANGNANLLELGPRKRQKVDDDAKSEASMASSSKAHAGLPPKPIAAAAEADASEAKPKRPGPRKADRQQTGAPRRGRGGMPPRPPWKGQLRGRRSLASCGLTNASLTSRTGVAAGAAGMRLALRRMGGSWMTGLLGHIIPRMLRSRHSRAIRGRGTGLRIRTTMHRILTPMAVVLLVRIRTMAIMPRIPIHSRLTVIILPSLLILRRLLPRPSRHIIATMALRLFLRLFLRLHRIPTLPTRALYLLLLLLHLRTPLLRCALHPLPPAQAFLLGNHLPLPLLPRSPAQAQTTRGAPRTWVPGPGYAARQKKSPSADAQDRQSSISSSTHDARQSAGAPDDRPGQRRPKPELLNEAAAREGSGSSSSEPPSTRAPTERGSSQVKGKKKETSSGSGDSRTPSVPRAVKPESQDLPNPNLNRTSQSGTKSSSPDKSAKSYRAALIEYCSRSSLPAPRFSSKEESGADGTARYKPSVIMGKEKLELPGPYEDRADGEERLALQVLKRMRAQAKKAKA
ncbi:hypothetical protein EVG20_g8744, partial [Dentipellis fragilis]